MRTAASFESSIGFLLSQLGVLATRAWTEVLAERGLTPHHHAVLLTLQSTGPLGVTALARIVLIDPRNMGPVIAPLELRGLLVRDAVVRDRRRRVIALSPAGARAAAELAAATGRIEDELLSPLPDAERAALRSHLHTLWLHAKGAPA